MTTDRDPLELPPRRPLPDPVRFRLRESLRAELTTEPRTSRYRAPLAAAAGVAVLAAAAAVITQSANGFGGTGIGAGPGSSRPVPTTPALPPPEPVLFGDPRITEDLDRCGAVAEASPRADEFATRSAWQPLYAVEHGGHRITAYREYGGRFGFCETTPTTAVVADPSAEPMSLGRQDGSGSAGLDYYALYLSDSGVLAGVAQGVAGLRFQVRTGRGVREVEPVLRQEAFMAAVGPLTDGDVIVTTPLDSTGEPAAGSEITFDRATVRPVGASATDRP